MTDVQQELMTPKEAASWFRRSVSWLRRQPNLVRLAGPGGQPLYHLAVCRAFVLGQMAGASGAELRRLQIAAMVRECGLSDEVVRSQLVPAEGAPGASPTKGETSI